MMKGRGVVTLDSSFHRHGLHGRILVAQTPLIASHRSLPLKGESLSKRNPSQRGIPLKEESLSKRNPSQGKSISRIPLKNPSQESFTQLESIQIE